MTKAAKPRVLIVEDDPAVRRLLKVFLSRENYEVALTANAEEALDRAADLSPELVILDLTLPTLDGIEVCRLLRSWLTAPILVLSATDDASTKVTALNAGADDYVTKPFASAELLARLKALLRRSREQPGSPSVRIADIEIDFAQRKVAVRGRNIRLTRTEFEVLAVLARNVGRVVPLETIIESVWGPDYYGGARTLRVHIGNLRRKLAGGHAHRQYIATEQGVGYQLRGGGAD